MNGFQIEKKEREREMYTATKPTDSSKKHGEETISFWTPDLSL